MRLALLGGPGAGKGTQSQALSQHLPFPSLSMGGILRNEIAAATPLGTAAQPYVEKGILLPDEILIQFMRHHLAQHDNQLGWILEGYPRTAFQAEELDFLLEERGQRLDWAIYLDVSETTMKDRSLLRSLIDDRPDIIQHRITHFQARTIPLLEYYAGTKRLITISAEADIETVTQDILGHILD